LVGQAVPPAHLSFRPHFPIIRRLLSLGFPSAVQIFVEGAVFGAVTVMAARFDEVSLAAHSIAVNVISITFMVLSIIPFLGCILLPLNLLAQLGYYFFFVPWCVSNYGASFGKKVMKLRVIPEGQPGAHITLGPAILRQFGNFLFLNLIVLAVKGDERISLSDMLAKSEVIKVDR
jgi:uncharacterized RDD family membrane protein YckC